MLKYRYCESGGMVYAADLKSAAFGLAGSSPASRTKFSGYDVMVAYDLAKVNVRVRFSLPAPLFLLFF